MDTIRKYIRKIIQEEFKFIDSHQKCCKINEYNERDSFLSNYDDALKFAYENIDGVSESFDCYEENPDDIQNAYLKEKYEDLVELYVNKYNELKNQETVIIYRLIKLNSLADLDTKEIGMFWSFEKDGVGSYGGSHPNRGMEKTGKPYVMEAEVGTKYIDWVTGFHSFMWYGEDQWECALSKGAEVEIYKINDKELDVPIRAIVGDY